MPRENPAMTAADVLLLHTIWVPFFSRSLLPRRCGEIECRRCRMLRASQSVVDKLAQMGDWTRRVALNVSPEFAIELEQASCAGQSPQFATPNRVLRKAHQL